MSHRDPNRKIEVLQDGTVLSHYFGQVTTLRPRLNRKGYACVSMRINGTSMNKAVHRLVADAHLPPRPSPIHQVRHLDGNKLNNHASNLAWGTPKENKADDKRLGVQIRGERQHFAKLTEDAVQQARAMSREGVSNRIIAEKFGVARNTIQSVVSRKNWKHVS
jgi:DNA-binding NarL/FixJ family response regulator